MRSGLDAEVDRALGTLVTVAPRDRAETGTLDVSDGTVFIGARRRPDGRVLWAAYSVASPRYLGVWRTTVAVLSIATILLGVCAIAAPSRGRSMTAHGSSDRGCSTWAPPRTAWR